MATAELVAPFPKLRFVDSNGNALSGGKLFTYTGGTSTKATTFTDSTGGTPNANPIILDTRGECNCWIPANTNFKFVLSPSTDTDPPTNAIWTVDNVSVNLPATNIIACTATGTNTIALTPVSGSVTAYTDQQLFSFYAAANSTGAVTINAGPGARNAYLPGGTQQAGADTFINGQFYVVAFNAALNSNAGGFVKVGQDATSATFSTLASAATTNIGSQNSEYIQITGTTTITAFDTALAGIQRTIEFAGALTLTNNASIILPGGANITTAAGDTAVFRSEGSGVWRCISYERAAIIPTAFNPTSVTNSLGSDVTLNNTASYFDGPSVAQGTTGTWFVSGTVTVSDTAATNAIFDAKLWDGTTVIASARALQAVANAHATIALSGFIASPAGNLRISVKDETATTGRINFNGSGNSKDSTITAIRIA